MTYLYHVNKVCLSVHSTKYSGNSFCVKGSVLSYHHYLKYNSSLMDLSWISEVSGIFILIQPHFHDVTNEISRSVNQIYW